MLEVIHHNGAYVNSSLQKNLETPAPSFHRARAEALRKACHTARDKSQVMFASRGNNQTVRLTEPVFFAVLLLIERPFVQAIFDEMLMSLQRYCALLAISLRPDASFCMQSSLNLPIFLPDSPLVLALKLASLSRRFITNIEGPLSRVVNQLSEMGKLVRHYSLQGVDSLLLPSFITVQLSLA